MQYDEFKEMVREDWSEKFNCLCIDVARFKKDGKCRIFKGNKNTHKECILKREAF